MFYPPFITKKMKCIILKNGYVVWVAKHLKGDWFIVLQLTIMPLNSFFIGVKTFIADVLKCKACLKTKFKCACITIVLSCNLLVKKEDRVL